MRLKHFVVLVWVFFALSACSNPLGNAADVVKVEIWNNPTDSSLVLGGQYKVVGFALDAAGKPVPLATVNLEWISSDPGVISVTKNYAEATVKALKVGTATLIAKSGNIQSKPVLVKVIQFDSNTAPLMPSMTVAVGKSLDNSSQAADIDAAGGTVSSSDGVLTVVVPAGAVPVNTLTTFSIDMLENTMPFADGFAYRVSAGSTSLLKPVELRFLSESDGFEQNASNLQIAHQNASGTWEVTTNTQVNPVVKTRAAPQTTLSTISVTTDKLGDFTISYGATLMPLRATVKTGQSIKLWAVKQTSSSTPGSTDFKTANYQTVPVTSWQVTGAGVVTPSANNTAFATFTAPNQKPASGAVMVSATIQDGSRTSSLYRVITIEEASAWADVNMLGQVHKVDKTTEYTATTDGSAYAKYFAVGTGGQVNAPTINFPGTGLANMVTKGALNDTYLVNLTYQYRLKSDCVCTPNNGIITENIDAVFKASGNILADALSVKMYWTLQASGDFGFLVGFDPLTIVGDLSFHQDETYPCGDRPQIPAKDETGKAVMHVVIQGDSQIKSFGTINPNVPGFIHDNLSAKVLFTNPTAVQQNAQDFPGGGFYGTLKASYWTDAGGNPVSGQGNLTTPLNAPLPLEVQTQPMPTIFPTSPSSAPKVKNTTPRC